MAHKYKNSKPRGGKRKGAGRPKGAINKATKEERKILAEGGVLPLEYMVKVMRDGRAPTARRDAMAIAAAPYLHARLSSTEIKVSKGEKFRKASIDMDPKEAMDAYLSTLSQPTFEDVKQLTYDGDKNKTN